jgi:P4 family phage/plasmid primase-like protien
MDTVLRSGIDILSNYGFKFFLCKGDKTPDTAGDWRKEENQIDAVTAEEMQFLGRMIGAWIPEDCVVVDIDRHEGRADGIKTMEELNKLYHIPLDYINNTMVVQTAGGGFHLYFTVEKGHGLKQGTNKAPGIDLKTNKGYVIAPGSPGYNSLNDYEPGSLPLEWIYFFEQLESEKKNGAVNIDNSNDKDNNIINVDFKNNQKNNKTIISYGLLKKILNQVDVKSFRENDRWIKFVMSALSVSGNTNEARALIQEWSEKDSAYMGDRSIEKRINSFDEITDITAGTFIHFLIKEDISKSLIKKISNVDYIETEIKEQKQPEKDLPFKDPDYPELANSQEAVEMLNIQGHTAAASVLVEALKDRIIYVDAEKTAFYFDGNKWVELNDYYSVVYTVLSRTLNFLYQKMKKDGNAEKIAENYLSIIKKLNDLNWKRSVWQETQAREPIFKKEIDWDNPGLKNTITCIDKVIDFNNGLITSRRGEREEYRRVYFEFNVDDILFSEDCPRFKEFVHDLMPDEETAKTLIYTSALSISGNTDKKRFMIFVGGNDNGKSTFIDILNKTLGKDLAKGFNPELIILQSGMQPSLTPEMAQFRGKRLLTSLETEKGKKFSVAKIKRLTGGDEINVNPKHKDPFDFFPTWQMVLAVNDLPSFSADDTAFINRLLIIPFKMQYCRNQMEYDEAVSNGKETKYLAFAKDKDGIVNGIREERAGVIRFLIESYVFLETALEGKIPESEECIREKKSYIKENDDLGAFLEACCEIDHTELNGWKESSQRVCDEYKAYIDSQRVSVSSMSRSIKKRTYGKVYSCTALVDLKDEWGNYTGKKVKKALMNLRLKTAEEIANDGVDKVKNKEADEKPGEIPFM